MIIDSQQQVVGIIDAIVTPDYTYGEASISDGETPGIGQTSKERVELKACTTGTTVRFKGEVDDQPTT